MVEIHENGENLNFPLEATAFLAAVSAFAVFLLVIFMYVNKKWHLFNINVGSPVGALRDMDGSGIGNRNGPSSLYPAVKSLQMNNVNLKSQSESYSIPSPDNSSDSEEDVLRRLRSMNVNINTGSGGNNNNGNGNVSIMQQTSTSYVVHHSNSLQHQHPHSLHNQAQSSSVSVPMHGFNSSFDSREGSPSRSSHSHNHHPHQHHVLHHQPLSVQLSGSPSRSAEGRRRLQMLHQQRSLDLDYMMGGGGSGVGGMSNTSPSRSHQMLQSHYNNPILPPHAHGHNPMNRSSSAHSHYSAPPLGGGGGYGMGSHMMGRRPLRVTTIRDIDDGASVGSSNGSRRRSHHQKGLMRSATGPRSATHETDLMSLAEKGKVCRESSASSTSSNVSAEDDLLRNHPNHHGAMIGARHHPHHLRRQQSDIGHQPNHTQQRSNSMISNGSLPRHHHGILTRQSSQSSSSSACRPHHHHPLTISSSNSAPVASSSGGGVAAENRALTMVHSNPNFRRLMMPPRTKSVDSESPPPSEQGLSTYGDSVADQDDHIFEEMSMEEGELGMIVERSRRIPTSPAQCGDFEVAFDYEAAARKLTVHVIQARGVPTKEVGGANHTQIRVVLLQSRKQRHKTKVRPGENPQFMESFVFNKINPEDVSSLGIRFRLYGCERMRREKLLGECVLGFGSIHLELESTLWLNFEPRYQLSWDARSECESLARSDSGSSAGSVQTGIPELLIGLAYNGTTGRLTAEIIKGSHFRNLAGGRAPDSYIKLVLVGCNGQEMGRAKSSLRRAQSNPLFKETFMFQVALFQVSEVTLLVSVYGRKGVTRRELLGWFALGYSSSGDEEATHWEDMCDAQGDQMCRWHVLLQS